LDNRVGQPQVSAPRQMSKEEERVSLSVAILQTIKVDEHEEEAAVLALRATAAGIVDSFLKATADYDKAWQAAKPAATA